MLLKLTVGLTLFFSVSIQALVPIENLVLGDYDDDSLLSNRSPLNYLFTELYEGQSKTTSHQRLQIKKMLGLYLEGENLKNFCEKRVPIKYVSDWEKRLAIRSILTTLQYVGLDISVKAIGRLSRELKFTENEYENFTNRLMLNYCSENTSVISLREIRNNLKNEFKNVRKKNDPLKYLPIDILNSVMQSKDKRKEQELLMASELFKSVCSWGGRTENVRLLVPLVTDPTIMSYIIRKMSDLEVDWDKEDDSVILVNAKNSHKALCENTVCRLRPSDEFEDLFPRSLGSTSIKDDIERLYCQNLSRLEYNEEGLPKVIRKWLKEKNKEGDQLLRSYFLSEVSGIPALDVQTEKFNQLRAILRSSIDKSWTDWAVLANENHINNLFFEEALSVEIIPRDRYYDFFTPKFSVEFGVNLGELDRSNMGHGKLTSVYNLEIRKEFLRWMRRSWILRNVNNDAELKYLRQRMRTQISWQIAELKKKFRIPFWQNNEDIEGLIANELLIQLESYRGTYFSEISGVSKKVVIPLKFYFGPFALKYLGHKAKIELWKKKK